MDNTASSLAARLISSFEGCNLSPYVCPAGRWSIGFGSTYLANGSAVTRNTPPITTTDADRLLMKDIETITRRLCTLVTIPLSDHEKSALVSLSYNIGLAAFQNSTLLQKLNRGDRKAAADEFLRWDKADQPGFGFVVMTGLQKRRQKERAVFLGAQV